MVTVLYTSNIDLTYTTRDIHGLGAFVIYDEPATPSDHEFIVCALAEPEGEVGSMGASEEVTGWEVRAMSENTRKKAAKARYTAAAERNILRESSTTEEMNQEAE